MCFRVVDLVSQGAAVQRHLRGRTEQEKIEWLATHGSLITVPRLEGFPQSYVFESEVGIKCGFFLREDVIVFIGDNTTFVVDHEDA